MKNELEINLDSKAVGKLQDVVGGGGTTVIANPELTGDEPDLEGLQVGDTKYAVPQGGGGIEYVELTVDFSNIDGATGNLTQEQLTKLQNGAFIKLSNTIPNTAYVVLSIALYNMVQNTMVYSSNVASINGISFTQITINTNDLGYTIKSVILQVQPS